MSLKKFIVDTKRVSILHMKEALEEKNIRVRRVPFGMIVTEKFCIDDTSPHSTVVNELFKVVSAFSVFIKVEDDEWDDFDAHESRMEGIEKRKGRTGTGTINIKGSHHEDLYDGRF